MLASLYNELEKFRQKRRWRRLRALGMELGKGVNLPRSTWIDISHCFLISIGDNCGFGEECMILAHDAMPNEYLDCTLVGRVKIHNSCHFGARTIILPGVEIGPGCVVGANSLVNRSIPPHTVAAGNPAKVIMTMEQYKLRHQKQIDNLPTFPYKDYSMEYLNPHRRIEMIRKLDRSNGYITGGYSAMLEDGACLFRTT